jgi:hypothetical protein
VRPERTQVTLKEPYLAPTRQDAPKGSALVHLGVHAFPLEERG